MSYNEVRTVSNKANCESIPSKYSWVWISGCDTILTLCYCTCGSGSLDKASGNVMKARAGPPLTTSSTSTPCWWARLPRILNTATPDMMEVMKSRDEITVAVT